VLEPSHAVPVLGVPPSVPSMNRVLLGLLLVLPVALAAQAGRAPFVVDLDVRGEGYPVYRIPALTRTNAGTLLAAYDGRPTEGDVPANIALVLRRSTDLGATWSERQVVRYEPGRHGYGDPSLLVDRTTGRIFLFHVAAINQGFLRSALGNDENDPDVLQMDYSHSDDDGRTWRAERITGEAKDPAWGGLFASSGEGIQLRRGRFAGRLIQQYAIRYRNETWAASLYSDDHGRTWRFGQLVGPGLDENKTVELSDGTLLLNSRASGGVRKVARSTDGGASYSAPQPEPALVDPANNGSIIRYDLDAAPDAPHARWLLFSNTEHPARRRNLTIKMSCDDGRSWPIRRVVEPGAAAYSTLTPLAQGRFGLLYEVAHETTGRIQAIRFLRFDRTWFGAACGD